MAQVPPAPFPPPPGRSPPPAGPPARPDRRRRRRRRAAAFLVSGLASAGIVAILAVLLSADGEDEPSERAALGAAPSPLPAGTPTGDVPGYPPGWFLYTAPDGSFAIVGPGVVPKESVDRLRQVDRHQVLFRGTVFGSYTVYYFDYPKGSRFLGDDLLLRRQVRLTLRDLETDAVEQLPLESAGFPGVRLAYASRGHQWLLDLYVIRGRLYQLGVGMEPPASDFALERGALFLSSFQPFPAGVPAGA